DPLRVVFIVPRPAARDVVEIAQRIPISYSVVPLWRPDAVSPPSEAEAANYAALQQDQRIGEFLDGLNAPLDVIVVGNVELAALPAGYGDGVRQRVREGAGLVWFHHGSGDSRAPVLLGDDYESASAPTWVTSGIGEEFTPEWADGFPFLRTGSFGDGRVAEFAYDREAAKTHFVLPALTNPQSARLPHFDTYLSLVGRVLLWAADREPEVTIASVESTGPEGPDELEAPPDLPEPFLQRMRDASLGQVFRPYRLRLSEPAPRDYNVTVQIRSPARERAILHEYSGRLVEGSQAYPFYLNVGPGEYLVDIWLRYRDRTVLWHTEAIELEGWPDISNVAFSKNTLQPHDTLDVTLNTRPDFHNPRPQTIYARAIDNYGRRVAEQYTPVGPDGGRVEFDLSFADLIGPVVKIEIFAVAQERGPFAEYELQHAAYRHGYLPVSHRLDRREFSLAVRGSGGAEYNLQHWNRVLRDHGVDTLYTPDGEGPSFFVKDKGLRQLRTLTNHRPESVNAEGERVPCISEAAYHQAQHQRLHHEATAPWDAGPPHYSLGHDNRLNSEEGQDACLCTHCTAAFQAWLGDRKGSLDALNAAWNTEYAEWSEVEPLDIETAIEEERPAPWIAHRLFMEERFSAVHGRDMGLLEELFPTVHAGISLSHSPSPFSGLNLDALSRGLSWISVPPEPTAMAPLRSRRRLDAYWSLSYNGPKSLEHGLSHARWLIWRAALNGFRGIVWNNALNPSGAGGLPEAITLDGRPTPLLEVLNETAETIRNTIGTMPQQGYLGHSGVAIYVNRPSYYLSHINPNAGATVPQTQERLHRALQDLGYQADLIASPELTGERLNEYTVLVLPMIKALETEEIAALEAFVDEGGVLVAAGLPGTHNASGVERDASPLAGLFSQDDEEDGAAEAEGEQGDITPLIAWRDAPEDGEERAIKTVLFEGELPEYGADTEADEAFRGALDSTMRNAGLRPIVELFQEDNWFPGERVGFRFGEARFVGLLRDPVRGPDQTRLRLNLSGGGYVYDLIAGEPVTRPQRISARLGRGEAALYSVLPYEVTELAMLAPEQVMAGERIPVALALRTQDGLPGRHWIRLRLEDPAGETVSYHSQTIEARDGRAQAYFPLAHNQRPGRYRVIARDMLTGRTATASVNVVRLTME
ncbi:MAG: beta-galactosidase trimerization domain-containing protein, partial [Candidatus Hydrogenedentota bacterium]